MHFNKLKYLLFLGLLLSSSIVYAKPNNKSVLLFGFNQYNDNPVGVIGDFQKFIGTVSGMNINAWYRTPLSKGTFLRLGISLDIGSDRKIEDPIYNTKYEYTHNRAEIPFLLGFMQETKTGMIYTAIGIQYFNYSAKLKVSSDSPVIRSVAFENDLGVPVDDYEYSVNEIGSYYFLFGMEGRFTKGMSGFIEYQHSYANGIGQVKSSSSKRNVHLRPSYQRWNVGVRYAY